MAVESIYSSMHFRWTFDCSAGQRHVVIRLDLPREAESRMTVDANNSKNRKVKLKKRGTLISFGCTHSASRCLQNRQVKSAWSTSEEDEDEEVIWIFWCSAMFHAR